MIDDPEWIRRFDHGEQILRFVYGGHVASDAFIVILGVLLMGFIAWAAEWRERLRAALANKSLSP